MKLFKILLFFALLHIPEISVSGSYTPTTWVNNSEPALNATQLNRIEAGVDSAHSELDANATLIDGKEDALTCSDTQIKKWSGGLWACTTDEIAADELTVDELAAINGAALPSATNVMATMADVVSAGGGDVSKVGTPLNKQVGVWTGDGTIQGDPGMTFVAATDVLTVAGAINATIFQSPQTATYPQYNVIYGTTANTLMSGTGAKAVPTNELIRQYPDADPTVGQIISWAVPTPVAYSATLNIDTTTGSWVTALLDGAGTVDFNNLAADAKFQSLSVADLNDTATPHVLTTSETTNKVISNYAVSGVDRVFTMPVAHAAGNIIFSIGDEFQVDIEPDSGELFYLNGTAMAVDEHIQNTADTLGERLVGYCVNINGSLTWMFYSSDTAWVEATP